MFARLKLCSYQKKPNDVTIFIYLCLPQEIFKSLFVKIRLRYRFDRHKSHPSSFHQEVILESHCLVTHYCHQEVMCHFTIIIDLRLEVFSVLLKFILLDVIVENNPYSFMEIQIVLCCRPKISTRKMEIQTVLCCRPKISTKKKIEKLKFKMCLMFYLLLFYQLLNNPI